MYMNSQSSDAASLHALELLMNEFFDASTNNHRKREIGMLISILMKRKIVDLLNIVKNNQQIFLTSLRLIIKFLNNLL